MELLMIRILVVNASPGKRHYYTVPSSIVSKNLLSTAMHFANALLERFNHHIRHLPLHRTHHRRM